MTCSACGDVLGLDGSCGSCGRPALTEVAVTVGPVSEPARPWAAPPELLAPPESAPPERPLLGLTPSLLQSGEALRAISFGLGVLLLAVFVSPWPGLRPGQGIWSWSGEADGVLAVLLWLPLPAGILLVLGGRLRLVPLARAAILLGVGSLGMLVVWPQLGEGGPAAMGWCRLCGVALAGAGLTLRALHEESTPARAMIGIGVAALALGWLLPVGGQVYGVGVVRRLFDAPGGLKIEAVLPLGTPFFALLGLSLLERDRRLGTTEWARGIASLFVLWPVLSSLLGLLLAVLVAPAWLAGGVMNGFKFTAYLGALTICLNHGLVAMVELMRKAPSP